MTQISQTGTTPAASLNASFTYDAFGRRIQSSISKQGQAAQTVQYLYEGNQALGEIRAGKLSHRLLTGLSLDETIARIALTANGQKDSTASRIYLTDALNSVIAQLSDDNASAGQIQNSYGYSPYGESTTIGPDSTNNPNQYISRENDQTGLMFYRNRYYDPVLKRFISSDPIGLDGGMNMFAYVEGDPLSFIDPEGLLISSTVGGARRNTTLDEAARLGAAGNAAAAAGLAGSVGGAAAAGAGADYMMCIPAPAKRAIGLLKGFSDDAMPPPVPPRPPLLTPPAITRPGGFNPPAPPPGISPRL